MAIAFKTKQKALEFLRSLRDYYEHRDGVFSPAGVYVLAYGEESSPDYYPCRYKDGWGIKGVFHYLPGTLNAPTDGRCDVEDVSDFVLPVYALVRVR